MEQNYFQGTVKRKTQLLLYIILLLLPYALLQLGILSDPNSEPKDGLTMDERTEVLFESLYLSIYLNSYLLLLYTIGAIFCYIFARNTHISMQYPPPGSEMVFSTKIIKDKKALNYAYGMYFFADIMFLNGAAKFSVSVNWLHFVRDTLNVI